MSQRLPLTTTPERSRLMAGVRQTGTANELSVQKILRSLGHRFTVKAKDLPGTPDIVNRSQRWAIYVHGCFWHAHTCPLWKLPKGNRGFWTEKFAANKKRDKTKLKELRRQGYSVLTVWQCELKNEIKVRRKLQRFLSATNENIVSVVNPKPNLRTVTLSFRLDEKNRRVSRTATTLDGRSFTSRFDLLANVSTKQDARSLYDQVFLRSKKLAWHSPLRGTVRAADLFSGCGGLSLGTREACTALGKQFKSVLAIDEDLSSLEVYKRNFTPTLPIKENIWSVLSGELGARLEKAEKALLKKIGAVDICLAGPPCQGHSDLNNHTRRKDKRNHLYERVARFAEIAEPSHLIIENVPNVINAKERALDNTIARLEKLGYKVDTNVVHLADLGVPQRRKRDVLIASSSRLSIAEIVNRHKVSAERTLRWAIADLARRAPGSLLDTPSTLHPDNVERIQYLMKHDEYDLPNDLRPICHQDDHSYVSMYGRLDYDEPAQTITSGFGSPGQGRYIHPTCRRTLTPHEAARLQFFPDSFDFSQVKRRALAKMIANAVPMILTFVLLLELIGGVLI
ncbi:MAG TPA: DNA mismatch endonuclease Vsr [Pyrinomonadaceae bacterium]|nr:DNA mismatch endonuclease Vsr [Pyrinomonadaceae bacterium]